MDEIRKINFNFKLKVGNNGINEFILLFDLMTLIERTISILISVDTWENYRG